MKKSVLVIHGAGEPRRRDGKVYWERLLGPGLGPGYEVHAPRMPDPEDPHYQPWAGRIAELLEKNDQPVLVGHSLGASILLKYLSEVETRPALAGVFLIAMPFWGRDMPEFALRPDFADRLRTLDNLFLYRSRDDDVIPAEHLETYRRAFPRAVVRTLEGRGHEFDQDDFPELIADIRKVAPPTSR
jgi:predicted alpha/beta hydrolase family esterase